MRPQGNGYDIGAYEYVSGASSNCIHDADKQPCDRRIDTQELLDYINKWKNNQGVTISNVLQVINLWKSG